MGPRSIFLKAFSKTSIGWKSLQNIGCAQKNQGSDFCALDEGIKKHHPEALKSMKIKIQGLQHPFPKQLKSDTASEEASEPQFVSKICDFLINFGCQNEPKIEEKMSKMRCSKAIHFWINFIGFFFALASENKSKIHVISHFFSKTLSL